MNEATFQLFNMILVGVDEVIKDDRLMQLFGINRNLWPAIRYSWQERQVDF